MADASPVVPAAAAEAPQLKCREEKAVAPVAAAAAAPVSSAPAPVADAISSEQKKSGAATVKKEEEDDGLYPEEEELLEGDWMRPQVNLKEVEVKSGEEDEETMWQHRAKLYRWVKETSEWKERGLGEAKLLKHKTNNRVRFLLRQEKTLKIVSNHYVVRHGKFCQLTPNVASDKIWVWTVKDYAEDQPRIEQFGLKFGQVEDAIEFKKRFDEAAQINQDSFKNVLEKSSP